MFYPNVNFEAIEKYKFTTAWNTQVGAEVKNKQVDELKLSLRDIFRKCCCSFKSTLSLGHIKWDLSTNKKLVFLDKLKNVNLSSERASKKSFWRSIFWSYPDILILGLWQLVLGAPHMEPSLAQCKTAPAVYAGANCHHQSLSLGASLRTFSWGPGAFNSRGSEGIGFYSDISFWPWLFPSFIKPTRGILPWDPLLKEKHPLVNL